MPKNTNRYIAHIRQSDKCCQYVEEHNDNVADLAYDIAKPYGLDNLARIAGRHHDDGKNTSEFYQYIQDAAEGKEVVRGSVIHSTHGALLINELATSNFNSKLTAELLRTVILSHHGLRDCLSLQGEDVFEGATENISKSFAGVKKIVFQHYGEDFINREFENACKDTESIAKKIKQFLEHENEAIGTSHFYLAMFTRLLTSIVIDADRTDTACFEEQSEPPSRKTQCELKKIWETYLNYYENKLSELPKKKKTSILDSYRVEISKYCAEFDGERSGIYRLVVPCGAGKTLSALRYALHTAYRYEKERIIYIAPFNSILEQNAAEISDYIGDKDAVLEHHSNIIFESDQSEKEKKYQLLIENWAQSPVIATTAVQFLDTLFAGKTSSVRRMQALGNSVIIIDEIQALPIKLLKLFNGAMNFLAFFCNVSIVLCSATQPLLDKLNDYKILQPINIIPDENKYITAFKRVKIENRMRDRGYYSEEAGDFIIGQIEQARSVLAIVNTKACARDIYKYIQNSIQEKQCKIYHLSTNMCPAHRSKVLQEIRELLDQNNSDKKVICISTSLIEAGVDVSFARVVRSLTGLDRIIQAAGRCNRHFETDYGIVSVINIRDENIGGLSYLKYAQKATCELLYNIDMSPENYPEGLLSKRAMDEYYARYFNPLQRDMAYPLRNYPEHTLLDLLTTNPIGKNRFKNNYPQVELPIMKQAFKEAGEAFDVIENEATVDVCIEYDNKAKKLLNEFKNVSTIQGKRHALSKLQPYIVQIRENNWFRNEQVRFGQVDAKIWVLPKNYYNDDYGVDETAEVKMETLII
ncbi:MAG: CRISPR-associated helicase Cas3' [Clostridiales bacterium]|nr:CRISPR-associated helicase Cas3' [Clostridiales bacterium]